MGEGVTEEGVDADPPHVFKEAEVEEEEPDLIIIKKTRGGDRGRR